MRTITLKTEEAPNKWWAYQDAITRNAVNSTHYTQNQHVVVERMRWALEVVYNARIYVAYGKTGVSIKVDQPQIRDRKNLVLLEKDWTAAGVYKKVSAQGITYRLTKKYFDAILMA